MSGAESANEHAPSSHTQRRADHDTLPCALARARALARLSSMVQRGPPRLSCSSASWTAARRSGVLAEQISSDCQLPLNGSPIASKDAAPTLLRISSAKNSASSALGALMLIA